jgi:hypothetical protein
MLTDIHKYKVSDVCNLLSNGPEKTEYECGYMSTCESMCAVLCVSSYESVHVCVCAYVCTECMRVWVCVCNCAREQITAGQKC